jgi:hypothetical protein
VRNDFTADVLARTPVLISYGSTTRGSQDDAHPPGQDSPVGRSAMRACASCCREFTGRSPDCPFCGYNNGPQNAPRSARSLAQMREQRTANEEFEQELAELIADMAVCLGWNETLERDAADSHRADGLARDRRG